MSSLRRITRTQRRRRTHDCELAFEELEPDRLELRLGLPKPAVMAPLPDNKRSN
jgi:hypothetical protein